MTEAYPLQWPAGKPRRAYPESSRFGARSLDQSVNILLREIKLLAGSDPVISSNLKLRLDGLPYSKQPAPSDKGVAVYFTYKKRQMCFACDRWDKMQDNVYAIAMTIEALRGIERWGSGDMVQQAFTGFLALEAPKDPYKILGIRRDASEEEIKEAYRTMVKQNHPDMPGGSQAAIQEITEAKRKIDTGEV